MGPVLARFGVTVDGEDPGPTPNQAPTAGFSYTVNDLTASFTDASTDADGDILSRLWNFGDGNTSTVQNPVHTYAAYGGYTVSLTVTDNEDASDAASEVVTLTDPNAPPATVHVGDIDGSSKTAGKSGKWQATVEVTVHDNDEATVAGATVSATWSGALTGSVSATTDYRGIAVFSTGNMTSGTQVVLTVDNVAASGAEYDETVNHDPDGESSGTTITVTK
jgi:PKD repeat protein